MPVESTIQIFAKPMHEYIHPTRVCAQVESNLNYDFRYFV